MIRIGGIIQVGRNLTFEFLQRQFQLGNFPMDLLRRFAERHLAQSGERELQLLNLQCLDLKAGFCGRQLSLDSHKFIGLTGDDGFKFGNVVREIGGRGLHGLIITGTHLEPKCFCGFPLKNICFIPVLSRHLRTPCPLRHPPVDPFKQHAQLRR